MVQTSVGNMPIGFPGMRCAVGPYDASTYRNDKGALPMVSDITIVAANSTDYGFTINGYQIEYTSDAAATIPEIRDGLIAAARQIQDLEDVVGFQPSGQKIRVTALVPGTAFVYGETPADGNLSVAAVQANGTLEAVPFGLALVQATHAGAGDKSASLPGNAVAQVQDITITAVNDKLYTVALSIIHPDYGPLSVSASYTADSSATATEIQTGLLAALAQRADLANIATVAAESTDQIRVTSAVPGTPVTISEGNTSLAVEEVTANTGNVFVGIAERSRSDVAPDNTYVHDRYPPKSLMTVGERGAYLVRAETDVDKWDAAYFRHTASGVNTTLGAWRNDSDSGTAARASKSFFRTSGTAGSLVELFVDVSK